MIFGLGYGPVDRKIRCDFMAVSVGAGNSLREGESLIERYGGAGLEKAVPCRICASAYGNDEWDVLR
ncbi:MAG: hypothetical protein OEY86_08775, partial [Nitrospira sp.]|nr:hypothetical protein [Nitrospira sp.]